MRFEFDGAFEILIGHEGGHVDHPDDPGGETKFGISKRSYPEINIAALTLDTAKAIYKKDYWDRVKADKLPLELRFVLFDAAVNAGVAQSIKWLQRAVRAQADGVIGPKTLAAVSNLNPHQIASNFLGQRLKHMTGLRHWDQFGRGWASRISDNLTSLSSF
jgi:lysozyme family protein